MSYIQNQWEDQEILSLNKFINIENGIQQIDQERETTLNKVFVIDENSTDEEYPSAMAVYELYRILLNQLPGSQMKFIDDEDRIIKIFREVPEEINIF